MHNEDAVQVCPHCGREELYAATWLRMNPPHEPLDMIGDVEDPTTCRLLSPWCLKCRRDIQEKARPSRDAPFPF